MTIGIGDFYYTNNKFKCIPEFNCWDIWMIHDHTKVQPCHVSQPHGGDICDICDDTFANCSIDFIVVNCNPCNRIAAGNYLLTLIDLPRESSISL